MVMLETTELPSGGAEAGEVAAAGLGTAAGSAGAAAAGGVEVSWAVAGTVQDARSRRVSSTHAPCPCANTSARWRRRRLAPIGAAWRPPGVCWWPWRVLRPQDMQPNPAMGGYAVRLVGRRFGVTLTQPRPNQSGQKSAGFAEALALEPQQ